MDPRRGRRVRQPPGLRGQYHLPLAKPPNAISPTRAMMSPIQKLHTIMRTTPTMTDVPLPGDARGRAVASRGAARRFEDAAATNAAIGARPWVAHAKADHASVLLIRQAPGDRGQAGDLLCEALAIHEQLGMTASANRIAALLEETGGPLPREA
jgi:hypothetical protein